MIAAEEIVPDPSSERQIQNFPRRKISSEDRVLIPGLLDKGHYTAESSNGQHSLRKNGSGFQTIPIQSGRMSEKPFQSVL
jgi:hypothetical protein